MDEFAEAKRAIRREMLEARRALSDSERAARSEAVCRNVAALSEYAQARSILFYMPIRGEVDVTPLLAEALRRGKRCALPRCAEGRSLRLFTVTDLGRDVAPGTWGIPEPAGAGAVECTNERFSVILVPGVAFDRRGARIGYGAGYYDRLLRQAEGSLAVAPAYAFQVLDALPCCDWDRPVDRIVTEEAILDCRRARGSTDG